MYIFSNPQSLLAQGEQWEEVEKPEPLGRSCLARAWTLEGGGLPGGPGAKEETKPLPEMSQKGKKVRHALEPPSLSPLSVPPVPLLT